MPICPDCKSSELVQSVDPEFMTCTVCKAKFKLLTVCESINDISSILNHDATHSHSLLSKGPDHSNIANVATINEKQAKLTPAQKRGRSNIQT